MFQYRSPQIANLVAQLKRGPARLRLRQLSGIEFALSVVHADRQYPFDFVRHSITGYQARASEDVPEGQLLAGGDAREDLLTMAEELSCATEIFAARWPERLSSVAELAARFDVSTKTVFRWHRRGMIGWRIRGEDNRPRLVFPEHCVRRFVTENLDLVRRGSSFSQLSEAERTNILSRSQSYAADGVRTINAVAKAVAAETGRAVETIRLLLKQHDEANPRTGIFNRPRMDVAADDARLAIWEAYRDGAAIETLAERFERPAGAIYRIITEMRARDCKSREIEFVDSPEFAGANPGAILDSPDTARPYGDVGPTRRLPSELPAYLRQLFTIPLLSAAGEQALFRKMNYLRWMADQARKRLEPESATASELDEIESLLDQSGRVKSQIVQSNLRLVVSIAKKHMRRTNDLFELISDGNVSLMRAVDRFDYTRGFKFSTYASWAIMKNFARSLPEQVQHMERYRTGRDEMLESTVEAAPIEQDSDLLPALRGTVDRMLSTLDEREQSILRQRFGLDGGAQVVTLEEIGQRFGVSKERVRQLEARAMAKLRTEFAGDATKLLGA